VGTKARFREDKGDTSQEFFPIRLPGLFSKKAQTMQQVVSKQFSKVTKAQLSKKLLF